MVDAVPPRPSGPAWTRPVTSEVRPADPVADHVRKLYTLSEDLGEWPEDRKRRQQDAAEREVHTRERNEAQIEDVVDPVTHERITRPAKRREGPR